MILTLLILGTFSLHVAVSVSIQSQNETVPQIDAAQLGSLTWHETLSGFVLTNSGLQMPRLIYKLDPGGNASSWQGLVLGGLNAGFKGLDLAGWPKQDSYCPGVGTALATFFASGIARRAIFIQTKIIPHYAAKMHPDVPVRKQVELTIRHSLQNLGLDYVDSLLLAAPYSTHEQTMEAWSAMEDAVRMGWVRQLGLASFPMSKLLRVYTDSSLKPAVVYQHRLRTFREMHAWCTEVGIRIQLTWIENLSASHLMHSLQEKYNVTAQMLFFRFVLGLGAVPLISAQHRSSSLMDYLSAPQIPLAVRDAEAMDGMLEKSRIAKERTGKALSMTVDSYDATDELLQISANVISCCINIMMLSGICVSSVVIVVLRWQCSPVASIREPLLSKAS
eukprot:gnl/MRDRNA2_/MRDRNA2_188850_c0_seq1.p1 gnl/MRDRNA2_/MRDRNA2_188850_c0~~gnl/MRDRNA2_/MRDRNA2_188850_c0_seq1.p1  ORF type:complete len:391 (-),score=34.24 gnl/MRDRNA2_/MRDRNA2_188850_c0_seq1:1-1173(-)